MKPSAISVRPAAAFAWRSYQERLGLWLGILLLVCAAWVVLEVVVIAGQRLGVVWWAAAHLAFLIFVAGLQLGWLKAALAVYDGGTPILAEAWRHLAGGPKFLAGQLIYLLLTGAGLLLLILPGLYLGARYVWFGFGLAAGEPGLWRSFQRSAALGAAASGQLVALLAALLGFNLLGAAMLGLGLFITLPLSVLLLAAVYRQLRPR